MFPGASRAEDDQSTPDSRIIERLQAGDARAFAEVYDRYSRIVYGLVFRMVRNSALAEDLLQEIFLKLWKSASLLDSSVTSPGPWLITVARNHVLDYFKSGQNQRSMRSAPLNLRELAQRGSLPENDFFVEERAQLLRRALQRLEFRQRQVLELAYFEGLTQTEMAVVLNLPLGTVKSCVRLALRNLKEILDREEP